MKKLLTILSIPFVFLGIWSGLMYISSLVFQCTYADVLYSGGNFILFIVAVVTTVAVYIQVFENQE